MEKHFIDTVPEVVSFSRDLPDNKVFSQDIGTSTTKVVSLDQSSQTVDKQCAAVQTEKEDVITNSEYNEAALLDFMRRCAPRVELELRKTNKHFGKGFQQSVIDEEEVLTKKIKCLPRHEKVTEELIIRHICWSCYGNKIAANFSHVKHDSWCKHSSFILIYETDENEEFTNEAKECIEIDTCIVYMECHIFMNSVLIFATEEGKIYWHNTTDSLESNSKNYVHHHGGKITQLSWVELNSSIYLVISDSDGLLYFWTTSRYIKDWILWKKLTFKSPGDANERAVLCFDFSSLDSQNFVVGLEGGVLLHCTTSLMTTSEKQIYNPVVRDFECPSVMITNICFSKFEYNVFAISCTDQYLRIYYLNEKAPVCALVTSNIPLGMEWSHQERIFIAWFEDSEIAYYDYVKSSNVKSFKLEKKIHSIDVQVIGMKLMLAAADTNNDITIWQSSLYVT